MVIDLILAAGAVAITAARPRSWRGAAAVSAIAGVSLVLGTGMLRPALVATAPAVGFLLVALLAAGAAVGAGIPARLAAALAEVSRGRPFLLYSLVCAATAAATATVSLDGAVVFLVPTVLELGRFGAPRRPLLLGVVVVANTFSLALPEGNPTNLLVLGRLGVDAGGYTSRALPAGAAAAVICALAVALLERGRLRASGGEPTSGVAPAGLARGAAAVLRLGAQLTSLLVLLIPLAEHVRAPELGGIAGELAAACAAAAASCVANNLPAAAAAAAVGGPGAFAALAGLSVGALATEHGSVATLLAGDLAGIRAYDRRLAPVAAAALGVAVLLLWARGA
jgi:Na+/H+ antiporter NhaD/arsenite permease-like protein